MGRIWVQLNELDTYDIAQCTGLTDWNKPRGAVTPIREQSVIRVGDEDVVGYQRASKDMAAFTIQARLKEMHNFLIGLNCNVNVQVLFVDCGSPGNYYGYKMGIGWVRCPPGDLTGDAISTIEGDNVPIAYSNAFNAIYGPYLIDFQVKFTSALDIAETGTITDMVFFEEECLEDCQFKAGNGQYGYVVASAQVGSPVDDANVWFTEDYGDNCALTSETPFAGGEDISCVVKSGTVSDHRIIVSRGSADAANPAEIAYADVTTIGQTAWVNVNVGAVNGQYITYMTWPIYNKLFAVTNDGYIYQSADGGATWTVSYQHTAATQFNDISSTRRGVIWAGGDGDLLKYSTDYGGAWTTVTGPNAGLHNITTCFVDMDKKLEVGDSNGAIFGSVDNGLNWVTTPPQGITATNVVRIRGYHSHWKWAIVDIAAVAPANGNSRVLRSTDGGATWRLWQLATNIVPNDGLNAIFVVDVNRAVVGGAPYPWGGTALMSRTTTNIDKLA